MTEQQKQVLTAILHGCGGDPKKATVKAKTSGYAPQS